MWISGGGAFPNCQWLIGLVLLPRCKPVEIFITTELQILLLEKGHFQVNWDSFPILHIAHKPSCASIHYVCWIAVSAQTSPIILSHLPHWMSVKALLAFANVKLFFHKYSHMRLSMHSCAREAQQCDCSWEKRIKGTEEQKEIPRRLWENCSLAWLQFILFVSCPFS